MDGLIRLVGLSRLRGLAPVDDLGGATGFNVLNLINLFNPFNQL